jgi:hypothetical protein
MRQRLVCSNSSSTLSLTVCRLALAMVVVVAASAIGCAGKAFVRVDAPRAADGVSVALVEEECSLDQDTDQPGWFVLDLDLMVQVTNGAARPVAFHADRSRLTSPAGEAASDDRKDEVDVGPGAKKRLSVHFVQKGRDIGCNSPMSVAFGKALEIDHRAIPLSPLSFQPSNSPDS